MSFYLNFNPNEYGTTQTCPNHARQRDEIHRHANLNVCHFTIHLKLPFDYQLYLHRFPIPRSELRRNTLSIFSSILCLQNVSVRLPVFTIQ